MEIAIAGGIVGVTAVGMRLGLLDRFLYSGYKKYIRHSGCGGYKEIWKDDNGNVVHEGLSHNSGYMCGMGMMSDEAVSFVDELLNQRKNAQRPS